MLQEACQAVADTACRDIRPGDARIITCLLEKMDTEKMIPECEERLLEIQYFITRDWTMDPRFVISLANIVFQFIFVVS